MYPVVTKINARRGAAHRKVLAQIAGGFRRAVQNGIIYRQKSGYVIYIDSDKFPHGRFPIIVHMVRESGGVLGSGIEELQDIRPIAGIPDLEGLLFEVGDYEWSSKDSKFRTVNDNFRLFEDLSDAATHIYRTVIDCNAPRFASLLKLIKPLGLVDASATVTLQSLVKGEEDAVAPIKVAAIFFSTLPGSAIRPISGMSMQDTEPMDEEWEWEMPTEASESEEDSDSEDEDSDSEDEDSDSDSEEEGADSEEEEEDDADSEEEEEDDADSVEEEEEEEEDGADSEEAPSPKDAETDSDDGTDADSDSDTDSKSGGHAEEEDAQMHVVEEKEEDAQMHVVEEKEEEEEKEDDRPTPVGSKRLAQDPLLGEPVLKKTCNEEFVHHNVTPETLLDAAATAVISIDQPVSAQFDAHAAMAAVMSPVPATPKIFIEEMIGVAHGPYDGGLLVMPTADRGVVVEQRTEDSAPLQPAPAPLPCHCPRADEVRQEWEEIQRMKLDLIELQARVTNTESGLDRTRAVGHDTATATETLDTCVTQLVSTVNRLCVQTSDNEAEMHRTGSVMNQLLRVCSVIMSIVSARPAEEIAQQADKISEGTRDILNDNMSMLRSSMTAPGGLGQPAFDALYSSLNSATSIPLCQGWTDEDFSRILSSDTVMPTDTVMDSGHAQAVM